MSNNWKFNSYKASLSPIIVGVDPEDPIQCLYCGPKKMRPSIVYTLFRDLNDGDFVFVRSHDIGLFFVWIGQAQGDEESAFFKMVRVQWWVLVKKGKNLDE